MWQSGRGGYIILVNAPVMLGFVISAIQGGIFHNKDLNEFKGFLGKFIQNCGHELVMQGCSVLVSLILLVTFCLSSKMLDGFFKNTLPVLAAA
jgi:hypothetical protein